MELEAQNSPKFVGGHASTGVEVKEPMDKTVMGMIVFLSSEAVFFVLLILGYVYYNAKGSNTGPAPKDSLDITKTAFFTAFLLLSSVTIFFADRSFAKGKKVSYLAWMVGTIVLGAVFLVGQATEYIGLFNRQITMSRNTFGTTFFTLTGFHGLHVLIGLIALTFITVMTATNALKVGKSPAVEAVSLYWHFVDVVWIVVFSVVYLFSAS
jgi:heme/copper-type cytochrome/quinol oxidase subunit 3